MALNQDLAANFFGEYNFRPLLLTFNEIAAMKAAIGEGNEGALLFCPVFSSSAGIPEQIVTLRYILYKIVDDNYIPVRFDFKPVLGNMGPYYADLKNASLPNFLMNQSPLQTPPEASLDELFAFLTESSVDDDGNIIPNINEDNYFSFFLQKNADESISLSRTILLVKGGGGLDPTGGDVIQNGGPPIKK